MEEVRLVGVGPIKGEKWHLVLKRKGLELFDADDEFVIRIPNGEASMRIKFPSFWASVAALTVMGKNEQMYCFEPKPKTLRAVREMVADSLGQDPGAAAAVMRRKALRDLLIGGGSFILGVIFTAISFNNPDQDGKFFIMTGLIFVGIFEIIRGIYWSIQAAQQG